MFSLQLSVHAVLLEDGQLVLRQQDEVDAVGPYGFFGGPITLGETLPAALTRLVGSQLEFEVEALKLLYIAERFQPGNTKVHELAHFYLCARRGDGGEPLPAGAVLLNPQQAGPADIEPPVLCEVLAADMADGFQVSPKLIVVNELPEDSSAVSGVYRL